MCARVKALKAHALNIVTFYTYSEKFTRVIVMCQTPSKTQTDKGEMARLSGPVLSFVDSFVCPIVLCVCQGRPSYGENEAQMLHRNLGEGVKNTGSTNKYTNFGQLIIRKIIATRCHILGKMHQIRFEASVRLFDCPFVG